MREKAGTLQIDDDMAFQRREWTAQHVGWWGLTVFVTAAALGLFGGGPVSHAQAGEAGTPLWIEYERFIRLGAQTRLSVHTAGAAADAQGRLELRISARYFDSIRLHHVAPEPDAMEIGSDDVILRFTNSPSQGMSTIVFDVEPLDAGRQAATFGAGGAARTFTQFVYF